LLDLTVDGLPLIALHSFVQYCNLTLNTTTQTATHHNNIHQMTDSFAELRAAAIDGRTHNIYYRQHQLEALHKALLDHATEIKEAIAADYDHSPAEIAVEIHLALSALKQSYETLQPAKAHADEYLLASVNDAPSSKIPAGIAYIEPCTHTLFFSVIAPLGAAIAAGSCAIVLVCAGIDIHEKAWIANIFLRSLRTTSDLSIASCARL
jgi:acyl-CoA reductase-like NAD-dependent aldehyde dehydrogenase